MKWRSAALALASLTGAALFAQERFNTPEYNAVVDALICQCGCHLQVSTCAMDHCHSAEPIREEVTALLQKGESVENVIETFKERYGLTILAAPPAKGFHLTAWVTPFIALLVGLLVTWRVLRSWRRATVDTEPVTEPVTGAERARIEKELRELSS
jgi:cytochrome c-type biogenesis protein CcmH